MRLIDVNTLKFHEFYGSQLEEVSYAILSHTWHDEEVSYQEMKNESERHRAQSKEGYTKILLTVAQAKKDDLNRIWVDTCCIDKTSSAELTKAINSMYRWYERSTICYAYFQNVDSSPPVEGNDTQFKQSRWFTRGWTLQELVAPGEVIFYSKDWERIGEKLAVPSSTPTVNSIWGQKGKEALCEASGIPHDLLFGERPKDHYSVAQRMAWASKRVCTRIEDTAYCLLGLFDINMPLLYGEEQRAFTRLQEEIIRTIDDPSIYAWRIPKEYYWYHWYTTHASTTAPHKNINWSFHPILAPSPRLFENSGDVVCTGPERYEPSGLTKHGVRIELKLKPYPFPVPGHVLGHPDRHVFLAPLNCRYQHHSVQLDKPQNRIALLLVMAPSTTKSKGGDSSISHFYRVATKERFEVLGWPEDTKFVSKIIYIKQKLPESDIAATRSSFIFQFSGVPVDLSRHRDKGQLRLYLDYNAASPGNFPRFGYRVTDADPHTFRDWSHTLNCLGSSTAPGAFGRPRVFIIAGGCRDVVLVFQAAITMMPATTATAPRIPSPILLASVTKSDSTLNNEWAAREACESALSPGWNSHTYTEFPCRLPGVRFPDKTIEIGVSVVEIKLPGYGSWNGGKRISFTFTVSHTFSAT